MQDACLSVLLDRHPRLILCALRTTASAEPWSRPYHGQTGLGEEQSTFFTTRAESPALRNRRTMACVPRPGHIIQFAEQEWEPAPTQVADHMTLPRPTYVGHSEQHALPAQSLDHFLEKPTHQVWR